MKRPKEFPLEEQVELPPSRVEEARRIVEEYMKDLREMIRKLRQRLN